MIELPDVRIDRSSPVPFYFQLAELLEPEIASGRWQAGARMPSEPDLCARYGLSRTTVRQTLSRLEQRGLIDRRRGLGTFVQRPEPGLWLLQSSDGFSHAGLDRCGRTITSRILRAVRGPLPRWASDALDLPACAEGVTLERLRSVEGAVALYVVNHLPERLAGAALAITNQDDSLYWRLWERAGVIMHGAHRTLEAVPAEASVAALLEVNAGAPVVFIESVGWDAELRPFDTYRAWLRTDRTRIDIQVSGSAPAGRPTTHRPME